MITTLSRRHFLSAAAAAFLTTAVGIRSLPAMAGSIEASQDTLVFLNYRDLRDLNPHLYGGEMFAQEMLFEGSFESVELDVAKVLRSAVKSDASQVVFTHNHPSGILKPSNADLVTTQALEHTLFFAGIKMLDHIIVADGKCMSILPYLKGSGMNAKINREIKKNNRR